MHNYSIYSSFNWKPWALLCVSISYWIFPSLKSFTLENANCFIGLSLQNSFQMEEDGEEVIAASSDVIYLLEEEDIKDFSDLMCQGVDSDPLEDGVNKM